MSTITHPATEKAVDPFAPGRVWRAVTFRDQSITDTAVNILNERLDAIRTAIALDGLEAGDVQRRVETLSMLGDRFLVVSAEGDSAVDFIGHKRLSPLQIRAALLLLRTEARVQIELPFVNAYAQRMMLAREQQQTEAPDLLVPRDYGRTVKQH